MQLRFLSFLCPQFFKITKQDNRQATERKQILEPLNSENFELWEDDEEDKYDEQFSYELMLDQLHKSFIVDRDESDDELNLCAENIGDFILSPAKHLAHS